MKKIMRYLLVGLTAVCLGLGTFFLYKTTTPEFSLYQTYKDIQRDGIAGLEGHVTKKVYVEFSKAVTITPKSSWSNSAEMFRMLSYRHLAKHIKDIDWTIQKMVPNGKRVKVELECTFPENKHSTITAVMRKDNGKWKISSVGMLKPKLSTSYRMGDNKLRVPESIKP